MKANKMSEIFELSIREQLEGLKGSAFSSVDLVNSFLERIKKIDPKLNSFKKHIVRFIKAIYFRNS